MQLWTKATAVVFAACVLGGPARAIAGDLNPPPGPVQPTDATPLHAQSVTLPHTIAQPGRYRLTSSLTSDTDGLIIATDDVTIDLNGFTLSGGSGSAIRAPLGVTFTNVRVTNGFIRDWDAAGVNASLIDFGQQQTALLTNVHVDSVIVINCGTGIQGSEGLVVNDAQVSDCTVGISVGVAGVVRDSVVRSAASIGIASSSGGVIQRCAISQAGIGISAGDDAFVQHCSVATTTGVGVDLGFGSTLSDSQVNDAGSTGVQVYQRATVRNNTIINSALYGVGGVVSPGGAVSGQNVIDGNRIIDADSFSIFFEPTSTSFSNFIYRNIVNQAIWADGSDAPEAPDSTSAGPLTNISMP